MSDPQWNPRFVAYAAVHGRSPEEQLAHDREEWPGGVMAGFIIWIRRRWGEWRRAAKKCSVDYILSAEDHAAFDTWLKESK